MELNISSRSTDWRGARLSNFAPDPFTLDRQEFASVEGFIQGTKFCPGEPQREQAFASTGVRAKDFGKHAPHTYAWWQGATMTYGSIEHHRLIERAIRAKFDQNPGAREALIATEGHTLIHDVPGTPDTALPATVFCDILTRIRQELLAQRVVIRVSGETGTRRVHLEGTSLTEYGNTIQEALGKLVQSNPERFNIKIV